MARSLTPSRSLPKKLGLASGKYDIANHKFHMTGQTGPGQRDNTNRIFHMTGQPVK